MEACFEQLKEGIERHPILQRAERRVKGRLLVASLALLLQRKLGLRLRKAGEDLSANAALRSLPTVKLMEVEEGKAGRKRLVTSGSVHGWQVLRALRLKRRPPPSTDLAEAAAVVTN